MKMLKEFRDFAVKGNVLDMAVGIIIGGAFTTIVKSLVDDIMMPPIGLAVGGIDFSDLFLNLSGGDHTSLAAAKAAGAATINYGVFLNAIISFLIVAFSVFLLVKQVNRLKKLAEAKEAEAKKAEAVAAPPRQEVLLEEIRDLLKRS